MGLLLVMLEMPLYLVATNLTTLKVMMNNVINTMVLLLFVLEDCHLLVHVFHKRFRREFQHSSLLNVVGTVDPAYRTRI